VCVCVCVCVCVQLIATHVARTHPHDANTRLDYVPSHVPSSGLALGGTACAGEREPCELPTLPRSHDVDSKGDDDARMQHTTR